MSWKHNLFNNGSPDPVKLMISFGIGGFALWNFKPKWMFAHSVNSEVNTLIQKKYYTVFTSAFSEKDGMKLFFNSLSLYFFGPNVVSLVGPAGFYTLFFAGSIAHFIGNYYKSKKTSNYPQNLPAFTSQRASVASILAYYIIRNPWSQIYLFIFPVPAILVGLLLLVLSNQNNDHDSELLGMSGAAAFHILTLLRR